MQFTLAGAALSVLDSADPATKARRSRAIANDWTAGRISEIGAAVPPGPRPTVVTDATALVLVMPCSYLQLKMSASVRLKVTAG